MRSAIGTIGAWFRRKEVDSAAAVGLCCMHSVICALSNGDIAIDLG